MNYSLIACDLDGTLLDDNGEVSKDSLAAIREMSAWGIEFVLCTGRTFYEIPEPLRTFDAIRYYIYSDGAVVYDKKEDKLLFAHYFSGELLADLVGLLHRFDTMIEPYDDGYPKGNPSKLNRQSFAYYNIDPGYWAVMEKTRVGLEGFPEDLSALQKTEILNVFFRQKEERDFCFKLLWQRSDLAFTTSMDNNIEIMLPKVSKGSGLQALAEHLGIPQQKTMAVGDSQNDLSMFAFSGLAVASGSAAKEIRAVADLTACSNNESIPQYLLGYLREDDQLHAG